MAYRNSSQYYYTDADNRDGNDPMWASQHERHQSAREPHRLSAGGTDMVYSDTSSIASHPYPCSPRPPSYITSNTSDLGDFQDFNLFSNAVGSDEKTETDERTETLPMGSYIGSQGQIVEHIQAVGELFPSNLEASVKHSELDIPPSAQITGAPSHLNIDERVLAAGRFVSDNYQDILSSRNSELQSRKRFKEALELIANSIPDQQGLHCPYCSHKLGTRGTCWRHIQDKHIPRHEFRCPDCKRDGVKLKKPIHRRDKFSEHRLTHHGARPSKKEIEDCRHPFACRRKCPLCPTAVRGWRELEHHMLNDHCRKPSIGTSAVSSRRSSVQETVYSSDNELISPTSNIPLANQNESGHLLPSPRSGSSRRSSINFNTAPSMDHSPSRNSMHDSSHSPAISPRNTGPRIHPGGPRQNQQQGYSSLPWSPPDPLSGIPRDGGYDLNCTYHHGHNLAQCPACQDLARLNSQLLCHFCAGGAAATGFNPAQAYYPPELRVVTATPDPTEQTPLPSQFPATHSLVSGFQSNYPQHRGGQRHSPRTQEHQGSHFRGFNGGNNGGPSVLAVLNIPEPSEPIYCGPGIVDVASLGLGYIAPKLSISKSITDVGKSLSFIKEFFMGEPITTAKTTTTTTTTPFVESPMSATKYESPCDLSAQVDIGKGEKLNMNIRVEKGGNLLRSRVKIVVKLLKLRQSAAETAEQRRASGASNGEGGAILQSSEKHEEPLEERSQEDKESSASEGESLASSVESLAVSMANNLTISSQAHSITTDASNLEPEELDDEHEEHEEFPLSIYLTNLSHLQSCLENMSNWSDKLAELTGFKDPDQASSRFTELFFQYLFCLILMLNRSQGFESNKDLG